MPTAGALFNRPNPIGYDHQNQNKEFNTLEKQKTFDEKIQLIRNQGQVYIYDLAEQQTELVELMIRSLVENDHLSANVKLTMLTRWTSANTTGADIAVQKLLMDKPIEDGCTVYTFVFESGYLYAWEWFLGAAADTPLPLGQPTDTAPLDEDNSGALKYAELSELLSKPQPGRDKSKQELLEGRRHQRRTRRPWP